MRGESRDGYEISTDLPGVVNSSDRGSNCWARNHGYFEEYCLECNFEKSETLFYCLKVATYNNPYVSENVFVFFLVLRKSPGVETVFI